MERPSNIREALLADALGDLHKLLNRADKLVPAIDEARRSIDDARKALDESREAMVKTARGMPAEGEAVKRRVLAEVEDKRRATLQYLGENTHVLLAELTGRQTGAMSATAQSLVEENVGPKLRALAAKLAEQADRANDPWRDWLAHACTGVSSAVFALMLFQLSAHLFAPSRREPVEAVPQSLQSPAPETKASASPPPDGRRQRDKRPNGSEPR